MNACLTLYRQKISRELDAEWPSMAFWMRFEAGEELWGHVMGTCSESWQCLTVLSATAQPCTLDESNLRRAVDVLLGSPSFVKELRRLSSRALESFSLTVALMRQSYYDAGPLWL